MPSYQLITDRGTSACLPVTHSSSSAIRKSQLPKKSTSTTAWQPAASHSNKWMRYSCAILIEGVARQNWPSTPPFVGIPTTVLTRGPAGARTQDILLKSCIPPFADNRLTSVKRAVEGSLRQWLVGIVASALPSKTTRSTFHPRRLHAVPNE